jgi:hypothetical protein
MVAAGDFSLPRAFRDQARLWSETEFKGYLDKITHNVAIHPGEAPEVDLGLQLPHSGTLVRQDAMQMAHAFQIVISSAKALSASFSSWMLILGWRCRSSLPSPEGSRMVERM